MCSVDGCFEQGTPEGEAWHEQHERQVAEQSVDYDENIPWSLPE